MTSKRIARLQSLLRTHGQRTSRKLRRLHARRKERLISAYRALAREVVRILKRHRVTDLIVGDITGIREDMDFGPLNELVHNFWSFAELLDVLRDACERAARPVRSRVLCQGGHELHADVNGALNLLYREPEVRARAEGRPVWCTLRWNGHRWVPTESARRGTSSSDLQAALAA